MNRRDVMRAVGRLPWPPTEVMWEELERELQEIVDDGPGYATTSELLGQVRAKRAIFEWRRRHKLLDEDQPKTGFW